MTLNLRTNPLSHLENLVSQKCLVPRDKFPSELKPGAWCKCLGANEAYSVCQVFPRNNIPPDECYLDATVSRSMKDVPGADDQMLQRVEALEMSTDVASSIELTLFITEQLFTRDLGKITLEFLQHAALHYLVPLYLVIGCHVQSKDLEQIGIGSVRIDHAMGFNGDVIFNIEESSTVHVNDVQLLTTSVLPTYHQIGFERAQTDLHDLLQVVQMQKRCNWQVRPSLNALLVGAPGCGKTMLTQWFIKTYNCNCFTLMASHVIGQYPGETETTLRRKFEAVKVFAKKLQPKLPVVVLIEDLHLLCPTMKSNFSDSGNSLRICAQFLNLIDDLHASNIDVICLATTSMPESLNELARRPGRFEREISIPLPSEQERVDLFRELFNESFLSENWSLTNALMDSVAKQTQGFVAADLSLLVRNVGQYILRDSNIGFDNALLQVLKKAKPTSLHSTDVTVLKTYQRFDSIGGMQQLKRTLEVSILAGLKQSSAFKRFGLNLPKGVLLYGPPGCAKTTIAKCLATEANMTFISTSGAEVYSPYVGCAEKFVTKIFNTARKNVPCLIFLDEIDSLVGRRSADSRGDIQIRILSTLLTEMDGIVSSVTDTSSNHILVVAATNRPDMIDDALMRPGRFDKLIHVSAPDLESRLAILNLYSQRMPFARDVDLNIIAQRTENYSGADLCNVCNESALYALKNNFDADCIEMKDFEHILREQKSSLTNAQIQWYFEFENKFVR